jgi:DnaJ-class molecular chaperone
MNPYKILGLPYNAELSEIRKAYLNLAEQWNPRNNEDPDAKRIFQEISDAYAEITTIKNISDVYSEPATDILIGIDELFKDIINFKYSRVIIDDRHTNDKCTRCSGKGVVYIIDKISDWNMIKKSETCDNCGGNGYFGRLIESECTSELPISSLEFNDENISKIVAIPGGGDYFLDGTCRDLKVRFGIKIHPKFKLENGNICTDLTISFKESLLGFEKKINIIY